MPLVSLPSQAPGEEGDPKALQQAADEGRPRRPRAQVSSARRPRPRPSFGAEGTRGSCGRAGQGPEEDDHLVPRHGEGCHRQLQEVVQKHPSAHQPHPRTRVRAAPELTSLHTMEFSLVKALGARGVGQGRSEQPHADDGPPADDPAEPHLREGSQRSEECSLSMLRILRLRP